MSLSIRENLGSAEAAKAYNQKIYNYRAEARSKGYSTGCIGSLACENCYHVISDSICLCVGIFMCPKCGVLHGREKKEMMDKLRELKPVDSSFRLWTDGIAVPISLDLRPKAVEDYSI